MVAPSLLAAVDLIVSIMGPGGGGGPTESSISWATVGRFPRYFSPLSRRPIKLCNTSIELLILYGF